MRYTISLNAFSAAFTKVAHLLSSARLTTAGYPLAFTHTHTPFQLSGELKSKRLLACIRIRTLKFMCKNWCFHNLNIWMASRSFRLSYISAKEPVGSVVTGLRRLKVACCSVLLLLETKLKLLTQPTCHFSLAFSSDWDGEQQDPSVPATRLLWKWWKIHPARFCFISRSLQSLIKSAVKASTSILKVPESRWIFAVIRALIPPGI